MSTSYNVRFQKVYVYRGKRKVTYWVRWTVAGEPFKEKFANDALADSFRSELKRAASKGEAFDTGTGLPVSMRRAKETMAWYTFACRYVDMKWPAAAATSRRSIAEALTTATTALLSGRKGRPDDKEIRSALFNYAFNAPLRASAPPEVAKVLSWIERNTRAVTDLEEAEVLRATLNTVASKLDGTPAAATVVNRKRAVLFNALDYAVEIRLLETNPIPHLKWSPPRAEREIDPRVVANPVQARTLLAEVRNVRRAGPHLAACYALTYHAGLRPEEAVNLRRRNLALPDTGEPDDAWGELHVERAAPHAGSRWTNSGTTRDERGLKHRPDRAVRRVPVPPELVAILRAHLEQFGTDDDGRLFRGERGGPVPVRLYGAVWRTARERVFVPEVAAGPLVRRPYDLRHACVSTWLNAGVEPTRVAEWAGHSVEVLYRVYAKCLHGGDEAAKRKIMEAMR
ncbi:tyrosine-type recombinase/integrase [Actinosynnema sp. NPDC059797]